MMAVAGLGLGAVIQPIFVIAQSMVGPHQLGVGTSTTTFFRQLGQAFGGAIAITVFTSRVDGHLARELGADAAAALSADVRRGTPTAVAALDDNTRHLVERAFAGALHDGFVAMVPIAFTAVFVLALLPKVRLLAGEEAP